jgi:DUF2924 family protein
MMAYRLQSDAFGDLDKSIRRILRSGKEDGVGAPFDGRAPQTREGVSLKIGALLVREWKGRLERVMVLEEGFAWNGQTSGRMFPCRDLSRAACLRFRFPGFRSWTSSRLPSAAAQLLSFRLLTPASSRAICRANCLPTRSQSGNGRTWGGQSRCRVVPRFSGQQQFVTHTRHRGCRVSHSIDWRRGRACGRCFAGVAVFGAIQGVGIAVVIAVIEFLWDGWRPHCAVLGRVEGIRGYHDIRRYPHARQFPGLVLFRWDAPLFFANAELFKERALDVVAKAPTPVRWLVVAAEPVTSIGRRPLRARAVPERVESGQIHKGGRI